MRTLIPTMLFTFVLALPWAQADPLDRAVSLNNRAAMLADQERYLEAEAGYRAAIRLIERDYGARSPALAQPLNNLAIVHSRLGRLRDAEKGYLRSLAIREETDNAPPAALVRINLARLYSQQGRRAEAQMLLDEADQEGPVQPASLHTRAALLLDLRSYEEAALWAEEARQAWRAGGDAMEAAQARAMRGEALRLAGRLGQARLELAKALEELRDTLGDSHPEVGRVLVAYGQAVRATGERRRGRKLRAQGRAILAEAPDRAAREHIVDIGAGYTRSR